MSGESVFAYKIIADLLLLFDLKASSPIMSLYPCSLSVSATLLECAISSRGTRLLTVGFQEFISLYIWLSSLFELHHKGMFFHECESCFPSI